MATSDRLSGDLEAASTGCKPLEKTMSVSYAIKWIRNEDCS